MPKADMLHLSSCLRRDGRPPSARPGLRRSERSRNCSALLSVRLQLGPDYLYQITPSPPNLSDLLPGFVGFAACIVACMRLSDERIVSKKREKSHKGRKPTTANQAMINVGFCIKILNQSVQHVIISQEV